MTATLYDELRVLDLDSLYLDMDRYEVVAGSPTIEFYELAEELLEMELANKNVTSTGVSDLLKEELASYITMKLGNVYYNDDDDDLWGMCIEFNTISGNFNNQPLFNGNISEVHWKNQVDSVKRGYGYSYDDIERLKNAEYKAFDEVNETWSLESGIYDEDVLSYDNNGNILELKRSGFLSGSGFGNMDDLFYAYEGNKLMSVIDNAVNSGYGNSDFTDGASLSSEYFYDSNGNLTQDLNKGISHIEYNFLNLPEKIEFIGGESIEFVYDANGVNHHKIVESASGQIAHSYSVGEFHYEGDDLDFVSNSEGRGGSRWKCKCTGLLSL